MGGRWDSRQRDWEKDKHSSKWSSSQQRQRLSSWGPRGLMLYFPLAISLGLNALWISNSLKRTEDMPSSSSSRSVRHTDRTTSSSTPSLTASTSASSLYSSSEQSSGGASSWGLPELLLVGKPCGGAILEDAQRHLHDVVLIVSFADDASATNASSFVRELYGRFFQTVVVCSPTENEALKIEGRGARSWGKNPSYQYYFFPKIAARYRQAAGFFWVSGDVVINYWNFLGVDKDKLWLPDVGSHQSLVSYDLSQPLISESPLESEVQRKGVKSALERIEPSYVQQLALSVDPAISVFPTRTADIFYVPQRLAFTFAFDLIPAFRDFAVFQDIAVPTMFYAMEHPSKFDLVLGNIAYHEHGESAGEPWSLWTREAAAFHPWNLATLKSRGRLLASLGSADDCLKGLLEVASKRREAADASL